MTTGTLTDLQLAVMKALWQAGAGTVGDIQQALAREGRALAPTTVATLLQRLSRQGWVKHQRSGRQFVYRAKVDRAEAAKGVLQRVLGTFFGGKASALTAHLLESDQLNAADIDEMRKLLKEKKT